MIPAHERDTTCAGAGKLLLICTGTVVLGWLLLPEQKNEKKSIIY